MHFLHTIGEEDLQNRVIAAFWNPSKKDWTATCRSTCETLFGIDIVLFLHSAIAELCLALTLFYFSHLYQYHTCETLN
jgi:hypothetical protein